MDHYVRSSKVISLVTPNFFYLSMFLNIRQINFRKPFNAIEHFLLLGDRELNYQMYIWVRFRYLLITTRISYMPMDTAGNQ